MSEHLQRAPADVYDEIFVPAVFQQWGEVVAEAAAIATPQRVLDVACGTGVLARAVAARSGTGASVTGLDPSHEMLAVARRRSAGIDWRSGRAESLPFADASFDAVVSQFGFMFFEDRAAALHEMLRVLQPGGRMTIAICDALDHTPGYAVLAELLHRLFGEPVAQALRAPFMCADLRQLRAWCAEAGIADATIERRDGMIHFGSIKSLVSTERANAWTLGGLLDNAQFDLLLGHAEESLRPFVTSDGSVAFVMRALIITAAKS